MIDYTVSLDVQIYANNAEDAIAQISQVLADKGIKFWIGDVNEQ